MPLVDHSQACSATLFEPQSSPLHEVGPVLMTSYRPMKSRGILRLDVLTTLLSPMFESFVRGNEADNKVLRTSMRISFARLESLTILSTIARSAPH